MMKSGNFVASHLKPHNGGKLRDEQVQPNGVDLTIDEIYLVDGMAAIGDKEYNKPERFKAERVATGKSQRGTEKWCPLIGFTTWAQVLT